MALQRDDSLSTILPAYAVLENRGLVEARPQSGYDVRARLPSAAPEPRIAQPMAKPSPVRINDLTAEVLPLAADPSSVPFGAACPHPSLFPTQNLPAPSPPSAATTPPSSAATR